MKRAIPQIKAYLLRVVTPIRLAVIAILIATFWFFVLGDQGIYQFRRLMEMKHRFLIERAKLNEEVDRLSQERRLLKNPDNLEMIIRSELGYIRPGEILYEEKAHKEQ